MFVATAGGGIHNHQIFAERCGRSDDVAILVHGEAGAIEHHLIVTADLIDHDRRHAMAAHDGAEHFAAQFALAKVEGRGVDADEQAAALLHEFVDGVARVEAVGPEEFVVPGILTDGEGQVFGAERPCGLGMTGDEVAAIVKDVVSGEQEFGLAQQNAAALEDGGGVGGAFAGGFLGAADVAGDDGEGEIPGFVGKLLEGAFGLLGEAAFFDEVARGVAGEGELGEDGEFGAAFGCGAREADHEGEIAREIANRSVDLPEGDAHESSV